MAGKRVTSEQKSQVFQLRKLDLGYKEIASKVGISIPSVGNILRAVIPDEIKEAGALEKMLQNLENRFPGVINKIKSGEIRIKIKPATISVEEY